MAELIVALDVGSGDEALRIVDSLPNLEWAKVGPMLFLAAGPAIIRELKQRGIKVFLDLKWHDIPNSVAGAVEVAAGLGVDLATVHALGGERMLAAARAASGEMRLAAVSVLTSYTAEGYWETLGKVGDGGLAAEVERLADLALSCGMGGLVSSPSEIARIRARVGRDFWIVVPGIRPEGTAPNDQSRVSEPGAAVAAGATHLVVGRPITRAKNPSEVYHTIRNRIG
ncbi:MAG: orotidine-5'-phosphate decarboxylase [Gemmatimonadales bacterium]